MLEQTPSSTSTRQRRRFPRSYIIVLCTCVRSTGAFGDGTAKQQDTQTAVSGQAITINEIYRDNEGVDDREFVELFGPAGAALDALSVVEIEGDYNITGRQGTIDKVWLLEGHVIGADGLFLLADDAVVGLDFSLGVSNRLENGTATYLLVQDYDAEQFPRGTDLDADDDGVADNGVVLGTLIDGLAIVDGGVDVPEPQTDRTYFGVVRLASPGATAPAGVARRSNGLDTETQDDFCMLSHIGDGSDGLAVPGPGADNECASCPPPGDFNNDGRIDLLDFSRIQRCYTGHIGGDPPPLPGTCRCLDFDTDDDVDDSDFAEFLRLANG